jgi:formamidopyrimidine-DNA glycosylase
VPEGHVVHRQARELNKLFADHVVEVSSPQGRFSQAASVLNETKFVKSQAYGKHLFINFENGQVIHIHLGLYGKWTFLNHTPEPVGLIRLQISTSESCAQLRGPNACALISPAEVRKIKAKIGPDPIRKDDPSAVRIKVLASNTPIGVLLMDQTLFAGVGNIYRAEALFRAGINPQIPGKQLTSVQFDVLWNDLVDLMKIGVRRGRIDTVRPEHLPKAMKRAPREDRHGGEVYVYRRTGLSCFICSHEIAEADLRGRNLFWCPTCQK